MSSLVQVYFIFIWYDLSDSCYFHWSYYFSQLGVMHVLYFEAHLYVYENKSLPYMIQSVRISYYRVFVVVLSHGMFSMIFKYLCNPWTKMLLVHVLFDWISINYLVMILFSNIGCCVTVFCVFSVWWVNCAGSCLWSLSPLCNLIGPNSIPIDILKLINNNMSIEIINLSFTTGIYPTQLKLAKVIPTFKNKGDPLMVSNYS